MAGETILVECECIRDTQEGIDYYFAGRTYTLDMKWAKFRDIWKWFKPLNEIKEKQAEERLQDSILPSQRARNEAAKAANEEAKAKLAEAKK